MSRSDERLQVIIVSLYLRRTLEVTREGDLGVAASGFEVSLVYDFPSCEYLSLMYDFPLCKYYEILPMQYTGEKINIYRHFNIYVQDNF